MRRAAAEDILKFTCIFVYLFVYVCHVSWPNEKRYRPEIWYTYSHWPYIKTGFLFFSIKSPWRPLASKNCRVTWIFLISPRLSCCSFLPFSKFTRPDFLYKLLFFFLVNEACFCIFTNHNLICSVWFFSFMIMCFVFSFIKLFPG